MARRFILTGFMAILLTSCSNHDAGSGALAEPSVAEPSAAPAFAADADPCAGADREFGDARRTEYPALVAAALTVEVDPASVQIVGFMGVEDWSVVFATSPVADPAWFVFESDDGEQHFRDVWAGMAGDDDRPELVEWAAGLGAPDGFARCFAETVIN